MSTVVTVGASSYDASRHHTWGWADPREPTEFVVTTRRREYSLKMNLLDDLTVTCGLQTRRLSLAHPFGAIYLHLARPDRRSSYRLLREGSVRRAAMLAQRSGPRVFRNSSRVVALTLLAGVLSSGAVAAAGAGPVSRLSVGPGVASAFPGERGAIYVTNTTGVPGTVSQFGFDRAGILTPLSPASVGAGLVPVQVAVDVAVRSAYVTSFDNSISEYNIDPSSGVLSPKTPAAIPTGRIPTGVAVSPDGKSVYVSNDADNDVSMYSVDPLTGVLSPKNPATVGAGREPSSVAVTPDGRSVYVSNASDNTVWMYNVDPATGLLSPKTPATVVGDGGPRSVAITPNGKFAYVTNSNQGDDAVSQYDINPSTGLLSPNTPATVAAGVQPEGIVVAPDGKSAYVCDISGNTVSQYDIDLRSGALMPKTPATVAASGPIDLAVSPDGKSVYVTNYLGGGVSQYNVDGRTGTLSPKTPATVATTGANPEGIAVVPLPLMSRLAITTTSLPNGTVGARYRATLQAAGGAPPYTWTVVSGHLPPGLRLHRRTGVISGKPTAPGRYTFTVRVVDHRNSPRSEEQSDSRTFTITIQ